MRARFKTTNEHYVDKRISSSYGITLKGSWSLDDRTNLLRALDQLNNVLGGINQFTSGSTYTFSFNPNNYGGNTNGGDIDFHGPEGGIPYQNYYHEIAHAIDNQSGDYFTNRLNAHKVYAADRTFVMGGPASNYMRNSIGYAQEQIMDPMGQDVDAQQHPGNAPCPAHNDWCTTGNTSTEEWADLVANYVAGNFDDLYGMTRQNWVSDAWFNYFSPVGDRALLYP
jgi:hypothetical protein